MNKETFYSDDLRKFESLGINADLVNEAYALDIYENDSFSYWAERKKFYRVILDLRGNKKNVNIEALGTNNVIQTVRFDTGAEALKYYIDILSMDNKTFYEKNLIQSSLVLIVPMFYISDILFKVCLLPFLMIFQPRETIKFIKTETKGFKNLLKKLVAKTWIDFAWFNEYKFLFLIIYGAFGLGAILF
jgi:hypothetical protein